jgi:hypothetical protein
MKKITMCIMAACVLLTTVSGQLKAGSKSNAVSMPVSTPAKPAEAPTSIQRLEEIKAIDKSKLSSADKKELKKEVRSIKTELRTMDGSGGIYISVGAIIIILLLIIILL